MSDDIFGEHGLKEGSHQKPKDFLYQHNWIAFIIIVLAILTAQFWYQTIYEGINYLLYRDNIDLFRIIIMVTFLITGIFFLLTFFVFKIPIAAAFTY